MGIGTIAKTVAKGIAKANAPAPAPVPKAASMNDLTNHAFNYFDDGATFEDFVRENSGIHNEETLNNAWQGAQAEKAIMNRSNAAYLTGPRDMVAIHRMNSGGSYVFDAISNDGLPSPSLGIVKDLNALSEEFGDIVLVMNQSAFSPDRDPLNIVTIEDMWSPMLSSSGIRQGSKESLRDMTKVMVPDKKNFDPIGGLHRQEGTELEEAAFQENTFASAVRGPFKTLDEIRANRDRFNAEDNYWAKKELQQDTSAMYRHLEEAMSTVGGSPDPYQAFDRVMAILLEQKKGSGATRITNEEMTKAIKTYNAKNASNFGEIPLSDDIIGRFIGIADKSLNMPIRYNEVKPGKALRFGESQDVGMAILPSAEQQHNLRKNSLAVGLVDEFTGKPGELSPEMVQLAEFLAEKGVTVVISDGTGAKQIPDMYKFAAPPIATYMGMKAAQEGQEKPEGQETQ